MGVNMNGWYAGYAVASVVIVLVVVLVGWILGTASRINKQVGLIVDELAAIKGNTELVPAIGQVNEKLGGIVTHATAAREALAGAGGGS